MPTAAFVGTDFLMFLLGGWIELDLSAWGAECYD